MNRRLSFVSSEKRRASASSLKRALSTPLGGKPQAALYVVSTLLNERPRMLRKVALLTAVVAVWALAQSPLPPLPFPPLQMPQGTPEERAACVPDVHKFCGSDLQDTMRVLACLQANRPKISAACNRVLVSHGQ
jgi:hypothetical protein